MAGHNAGKLNGVDGVYVPRTMEPTEVIMEDVLRSSIREGIDNEENAQLIPGSLEQKRSDVLNNMVCQEMGMHFGVGGVNAGVLPASGASGPAPETPQN